MEQNYIFYLLCFIITFILLYQYLEYSKRIENFNILKIDDKIVLEPSADIKIGKNYTQHDSGIRSGGELRVNKLTFKNGRQTKSLDEDMLKRIKSFFNIRRMNTKKGDKLCLRDQNGKMVCCSKEELGILTGQTPFKLRIAGKKEQVSIDGKRFPSDSDLADVEYPDMFPMNVGNKPSFYDKRFIMIPPDMEETSDQDTSLKYSYWVTVPYYSESQLKSMQDEIKKASERAATAKKNRDIAIGVGVTGAVLGGIACAFSFGYGCYAAYAGIAGAAKGGTSEDTKYKKALVDVKGKTANYEAAKHRTKQELRTSYYKVPSDGFITKRSDINYYCNIENKSPGTTFSHV